MDLEAIRRLKYAYFRCVDTANLEGLATLLHEEVSVHFVGGNYEWQVQGKVEGMWLIRETNPALATAGSQIEITAPGGKLSYKTWIFNQQTI